MSESKRVRILAAPAVAALLGVLLGSFSQCNTQQVTTPTRSLDRPSDLALFCVDYDLSDCLPPGKADSDPAAYLADFCSQSRIDATRAMTPKATVLAIEECEDGPRRVRRDAYFKEVRKAAIALGRDPDVPCCNSGDTSCTIAPPVCTRRALVTLVANTARGELAVADTEARQPGLSTRGRLTNLHGGRPGWGFLPVGRLPEHVRSFAPRDTQVLPDRVDSRLAWAVTTNSGSCDLSLVNLQPLADMTARAASCDDEGQTCATPECDATTCPQRVELSVPSAMGGGRPLRARPDWVEIAPWSAGPRRSAVISLSSCGVVAVVDLSDGPQRGRITQALSVTSQGSKLLSDAELAGLSCQSDCGGDGTATGGTPDGGAPVASAQPYSLAFDVAGQRLLVGDLVGSDITIVDYDKTAADTAHLRGTPRRLALDFNVPAESLRGGQKGIGPIRVSPRTPAGQFAYVVARDSSVRVVDLDREIECETNPDPRYLQKLAGTTARVLPDELNDSNLRRLSCFPVGANRTPRAPLASGPGLTLSNNSLPRDVGFVHVDNWPCDTNDTGVCNFASGASQDAWLPAAAGLWMGDFAWVLGGAARLSAIQLADYCPGPSYRVCFPEQGALRRVAFLHTRSQALPSPELQELPVLQQALWLTPADRLSNTRRSFSRFDDRSEVGPGPRTDSDSRGLPVFAARVAGSQVNYFGTVGNRQRLLLPAITPYYYLPVDPVCDVAIKEQRETRGAPDTGLPDEPMRRPVEMVHFTDPLSSTTETWSLDWEGPLPSVIRNSGTLLPEGKLIDPSGLFCSSGVEEGDKLWLAGCLSNNDCSTDTRCQLEQSQSSVPGLCLSTDNAKLCRDLSQRLLTDNARDTIWATTWLRRYRILTAEQQVKETYMSQNGGSSATDIVDRLMLDEITEPEYELEQERCPTAQIGDRCTGPIAVEKRSGRTQDAPLIRFPTCRVGGKKGGGTEQRCILECSSNDDCGAGFVCARSKHEALEPADKRKPRCVRAPLIHPDTPIRRDGTWQPMGAEAELYLRSCTPNPVRYEVHGGDSFMVSRVIGQTSQVLVFGQRDASGKCRRPPPGDPSYTVARLFEPRLRLGPRDSLPANSTDPLRCPRDTKSPGGWISHRVPPVPEIDQQPSCQQLFANGGRIKLPKTTAESDPSSCTSGCLNLMRGKDALPPLGDPRDPWLDLEHELLGSLPIEGGSNQCLLTEKPQEDYVTEPASCSGFCRFPGDHTEVTGVRRIHYENVFGNMVLRVPRGLNDPNLPRKENCTEDEAKAGVCNPALWRVPPQGYAMSFGIYGGQRPYEQLAQTAQQDVSSGIAAQGLRAAVTAPAATIYVVDEGRGASLSGLRGQVMRIIGNGLDSYFLLR